MNLLILFTGYNLEDQLSFLEKATFLNDIWKLRIVNQDNGLPKIPERLKEITEIVSKDEAVEHWDDVMHHVIRMDRELSYFSPILSLLKENSYFYTLWVSVRHFAWVKYKTV